MLCTPEASPCKINRSHKLILFFYKRGRASARPPILRTHPPRPVKRAPQLPVPGDRREPGVSCTSSVSCGAAKRPLKPFDMQGRTTMCPLHRRRRRLIISSPTSSRRRWCGVHNAPLLSASERSTNLHLLLDCNFKYSYRSIGHWRHIDSYRIRGHRFCRMHHVVLISVHTIAVGCVKLHRHPLSVLHVI